MFKFVTIYRLVDDQEQAQKFFQEQHMPLAEALPHVLKYEISHIHGKPGGQSRFTLMHELYFNSEDDFWTALRTEEGEKLMAALKPWGDAKLISWFYAQPQEETAEESSVWRRKLR